MLVRSLFEILLRIILCVFVGVWDVLIQFICWNHQFHAQLCKEMQRNVGLSVLRLCIILLANPSGRK